MLEQPDSHICLDAKRGVFQSFSLYVHWSATALILIGGLSCDL